MNKIPQEPATSIRRREVLIVISRCLHWLPHHFQTDWQNYERASWVRPATATL